MKTRNSHGLLQLGREALAYCQCASALISGNKALFVSVDLIGGKNQVILELQLKHFHTFHVLKLLVSLRIFILTDEGSVPEIRIWFILFITSDLIWCMYLKEVKYRSTDGCLKKKTSSTEIDLTRASQSVHNSPVI